MSGRGMMMTMADVKCTAHLLATDLQHNPFPRLFTASLT
jgi:hypothetical protein